MANTSSSSSLPEYKILEIHSINHRSAPNTSTAQYFMAAQYFMDTPLFSTLHQMMNVPEDTNKSFNSPTRTYVRDASAMAFTLADVKEYPNSYSFLIDMPGLKSGDIKVQLEDDNVLVINGERKREEEKEGAKYLRMERRIGKFMRKFVLPENANVEAISAACQDGVLTVTVEKKPPAEPKKPKTIEVKIA